MPNITSVFMIIAFLLLYPGSSFSEAISKPKEARQGGAGAPNVLQNPHKSGRGRKIGGIIILAVGSGIGGAALLAGAAMNCDPSCGEYDADSSRKKQCKNDKTGIMIAGGGVMLLSAGIGIPLLMSGIEMNRIRRQWFEEHEEASNLKTDSLSYNQSLNLIYTRENLVGLRWSLDF